jgi:hypothetical protein
VSKVLRRDPWCTFSDLGQIASCSGRSTDDLGKRLVVDFRRLLVLDHECDGMGFQGTRLDVPASPVAR